MLAFSRISRVGLRVVQYKGTPLCSPTSVFAGRETDYASLAAFLQSPEAIERGWLPSIPNADVGHSGSTAQASLLDAGAFESERQRRAAAFFTECPATHGGVTGIAQDGPDQRALNLDLAIASTAMLEFAKRPLHLTDFGAGTGRALRTWVRHVRPEFLTAVEPNAGLHSALCAEAKGLGLVEGATFSLRAEVVGAPDGGQEPAATQAMQALAMCGVAQYLSDAQIAALLGHFEAVILQEDVSTHCDVAMLHERDGAYNRTEGQWRELIQGAGLRVAWERLAPVEGFTTWTWLLRRLSG
jgi:hypothetical protein